MVYEGTETIYIRWYQRWSDNFLFKGHNLYALSGSRGAAETDHTLYVEVAPEVCEAEEPTPTGHPRVVVRTTTDVFERDGWYDNYFPWCMEDVTIERNRWYCFEILATMNTPYDPTAEHPSQWNGTIQFWLDGEKLLYLEDVFMRHGFSPPGTPFSIPTLG